MKRLDKAVVKWMEHVGPYVLGSLQLCIGITLSVLAAVLKVDTSRTAVGLVQQVWIGEVLSDLGIGIIAIGMLTLVIEPINRRRHNDEIVEIRRASAASALATAMDPKIVDQAIDYLVKGPFVRDLYQTKIVLEWGEKKKSYLSIRVEVEYLVKNYGKTEATHTISAFEDPCEGYNLPEIMKTAARIERVTVEKGGRREVYAGEEIKDYLTCDSKTGRLGVALPLNLMPGESAKVQVVTWNLAKLDDVYVLRMTGPTTNFALAVTHPSDIKLVCDGIHPLGQKALNPIGENDGSLKQWTTGTLLPAQGVIVHWYKLLPPPQSSKRQVTR